VSNQENGDQGQKSPMMKSRSSGIDIEKERSKIKGLSFGNVEAAVDLALGYLDELEATRSELEKALSKNDYYEFYCDMQNERNALRAQLADQRAQAIRMMAKDFLSCETRTGVAIASAAKLYDRLAAIPVPPAEGESC
jgi:molecular chaperone GrpE (heat shock protein)